MRAQAGEGFRFRMLTEVHCGIGITDDLEEHLVGLSLTNCTVVVDRNIRESLQVKRVLNILGGISNLQCIDGPAGEPDFEYLEDLKSLALANKPATIVGIGGGSTLDAAKGLGIVLTNDGPCEQYQGLDLYKNPGVPCVAIPTLFGSGAEITPSAVFFNRSKNKKGGINGRAVFPRVALVDPKMMVGAPLPLIGSTAMDALVHSIESFAARCATPVSKMFSLNAVQSLFYALNIIKEDSSCLEGLSSLALGTFQAITALMHSEQGLAGGSSYPMGVFCNIPHGVGGGRSLPHAIMFNAGKHEGLWDELATGVGWSQEAGVNSARMLAEKLLAIMKDFDVPLLGEWLKEGDIPLLSQEIYDFQGVMEQNPVELSVEDMGAFLGAILKNELSLEQYN